MSDAISPEKIDSHSTFSRCDSGSLASSLWTRENFQSVNNQATSTLPKFDVFSSNESLGIITRAADGFTLYDGAIADKPEQSEKTTELEKSPNIWYHQPIIEAQKLQEQAKQEKIGSFSLQAPPRGTPKCNVFVYAVMDAAGVPLPRGPHAEALTAGDLEHALDKDCRFQKVFARQIDESKWPSDRQRYLNNFRAEDGDIAIWNNRYLQHTGILEETLDGHGNTYYAGTDNGTGLGHTNMDLWWVNSHTKGYGAPDAIFRYKHFVR